MVDGKGCGEIWLEPIKSISLQKINVRGKMDRTSDNMQKKTQSSDACHSNISNMANLARRECVRWALDTPTRSSFACNIDFNTIILSTQYSLIYPVLSAALASSRTLIKCILKYLCLVTICTPLPPTQCCKGLLRLCLCFHLLLLTQACILNTSPVNIFTCTSKTDISLPGEIGRAWSHTHASLCIQYSIYMLATLAPGGYWHVKPQPIGGKVTHKEALVEPVEAVTRRPPHGVQLVKFATKSL
jgi:hypothetical protein